LSTNIWGGVCSRATARWVLQHAARNSSRKTDVNPTTHEKKKKKNRWE
jgi:hypothetical protein